MAHFCNYCEYLFDRPHKNCPVCGGPINSDSRPNSALQALGYCPAPGVQLQADAQDDFYSALDKAFRAQHTDETGKTHPAPVSGPQPQTNLPPTPTIPPLEEEGFFGQYEQSSTRAHIPEQVAPGPSARAEQDDMNRALDEYTRQVRATVRPARRLRGSSWPQAFNWGLFWRIMMVVGVVLFLMYVWSQRFVIANAILNLFIALIPGILIIWVIIWLIRSLFRH
ncbi:MAG: hypothetical protein PUC47_05565 [Oscillospiraceae bacterium]|nr:hypothetical protein [Oscillospiraceae bacterium]